MRVYPPCSCRAARVFLLLTHVELELLTLISVGSVSRITHVGREGAAVLVINASTINRKASQPPFNQALDFNQG